MTLNFQEILAKLKHDPFGIAKRVFFKTVVGPLKYKKGNDYDAERYWGDRFNKYGLSLRGPGDEGFSHEENLRVYNDAGSQLLGLIKEQGLSLSTAKVLEIGLGNGFYSEFLLKSGALNLKSLDITDVLFNAVKEKVAAITKSSDANFSLEKLDVTTQKISGQFDIILFIDVIEHIVTKEKLAFALKNIESAASPGAVLFLTPVVDRSRPHLFYNSEWSLSDISPFFEGWKISPHLKFRDGNLVSLRKPL